MIYDYDAIDNYLEIIRNNKTAGTGISQREARNIKASERHYENSENHKRAMKRWREKNKERIKRYNAEYRSLYPEIDRLTQKRWRGNNKEHIRKYSAEYRSKETPEQRKNRLDYMKKWYQERKKHESKS